MSDGPPAARVFEALANPYRRQLLLALCEANPQDDDDLDPLNLLEEGETTNNGDIAQPSLRHVHLPKLVEMGFIEWDRELGDISKGPNWKEIAPLLRLMQNHPEELPEEWLR